MHATQGICINSISHFERWANSIYVHLPSTTFLHGFLSQRFKAWTWGYCLPPSPGDWKRSDWGDFIWSQGLFLRLHQNKLGIQKKIQVRVLCDDLGAEVGIEAHVMPSCSERHCATNIHYIRNDCAAIMNYYHTLNCFTPWLNPSSHKGAVKRVAMSESLKYQKGTDENWVCAS